MANTNRTKNMNMSDADFIWLAYQFILQRTPDSAGLEHYARMLSRGSGRGAVLNDLLNSKEARGLLTAERLREMPAHFAYLIEDENRSRSFWGRFNYLNNFLRKINALESLVENLPDKLLSREKEIVRQLRSSDHGGNIKFAIRVTGGIGDAVIIARFVRDFVKFLDTPIIFDVYFHSFEEISNIYSFIPGFRVGLGDEILDRSIESYDFILYANQFLTFNNESINFDRLINACPRVLQVYSNVQRKRVKIEKYIQNHPNLDGAFADLATKSGHKRYTYLHEMAGIRYGGDLMPLNVNLGAFSRYGLSGVKYITIHDGWDTKFQFKKQVYRPTKAIPKNTLAEIVSRIKAAYARITIVQIGGETGDSIPGVDLDLKGKLTLSESIGVLSKSSLHIDSESGLVHIAAAFGVKSAALYGPTNIDWFSYPQNVNIQPAECGNCWWSTDTWMEECPAGHKLPVCMHSHRPVHFMNKVEIGL